MAVEGAHKAKEAASALTDDTDSRHVIHFRFFPRYSRLRASMHRMHTTSDRDNATFARLNLFPERKEESVVWTRHSDRAYKYDFCGNDNQYSACIPISQETKGIFWAGQTDGWTAVCDVTSNSGVKREVSFRERAGRQSPSAGGNARHQGECPQEFLARRRRRRRCCC